jgi:hypothetical protein
MSTNSRQKKAKNPKVQALIDAINEGIKAKKDWLKIVTEIEDEKERRFQEWIKATEPQRREYQKAQEQMALNRARDRAPLPLP